MIGATAARHAGVQREAGGRAGRIDLSAARLVLTTILAGYLLLAVAYGVTTPILEASDENWHEAVVWRIMAGHGLPVLNPADHNHILVPAQEAGQPPLYYLLAAAETFWIHPPAPDRAMQPSPNADIGQPDRSNWHKNLLVHGPAETFPWHGLALAVHLQRLLSSLFGAVTVATVYALAREALPENRSAAALAAAFVAFNPMFLFISASVDNDALAISLSTLGLLALARALQRGATWREAALVGTLVSLATLTKLSAAAIALLAVLVFLWLARAARPLRTACQYLAALAVPMALFSGWWFVRSWSLYGDPLGLAAFVQVAGARPEPLTMPELVAEAPSLWDGFWGVFGIFDILLPAGYYIAARAFLALAGLGLLFVLVRALRRRAPSGSAPVLLLLAGWLALEAALLVRWTAATQASSGRLLFPALGSVSVLSALGWTSLAGRWHALSSAALSLLLACGGALAIPAAIIPAYATPSLIPASSLRPPVALGYRYGNLELIGAALPPQPLVPGSTVDVTLYWAAVGPLTQNDVVSVQLFGPAGVRVEQLQHRTDAFPGGGEVLTARWPVGMGLIDHIPVHLRDDIPAPSLVHVDVFVYPDGQQGRPIPALTEAGRPVSIPEIGRLVYGRPTAPSKQPVAVFSGQIALMGSELPASAPAGGVLRVGVRWRALVPPAGSYTVFVHVGPPNQAPLAGHDQQPLGGKLPTTDWVGGETVDDAVSVALPTTLTPGAYPVSIGIYAPSSGLRLTTPTGASQVTIGNVHVAPGGG